MKAWIKHVEQAEDRDERVQRSVDALPTHIERGHLHLQTAPGVTHTTKRPTKSEPFVAGSIGPV